MKKDVEQLMRRVDQTPGWRVRRTRRHWQALGPDGAIVVAALTPGPRRALTCIEADLKRAGWDNRGST